MTFWSQIFFIKILDKSDDFKIKKNKKKVSEFEPGTDQQMKFKKKCFFISSEIFARYGRGGESNGGLYEISHISLPK